MTTSNPPAKNPRDLDVAAFRARVDNGGLSKADEHALLDEVEVLRAEAREIASTADRGLEAAARGLDQRDRAVSALYAAKAKCAELRGIFDRQARRASEARNTEAVGLRGDRVGVVLSIESVIDAGLDRVVDGGGV